ncbi:MAG: protein kinase [Myxococcales bacterium]|nr:protein kinase [Myxococcales bacterium]MCB9718599.1 protein kinase [Myxococcales bacterium]
MPGDPHEIDTLVDQPMEPEPEPELGELFAGRYRIERRIGRGSMGTVYSAHDRVVDERVALKLLATPSEDALERFRREVRLARRVTHRNAARTFDLGEIAGVHFITMELVEGDSLAQLLQGGQLPPSRVVAIAQQLCRGLQAAHDVEVIHRDLKPANVLIEEGGRAVITDFGVAWSSDDSAGETGGGESMAGTPAYMAPEQVLGLPLDARADLYALGTVLFEMLTGRTPFSGGNRIEVAMARLHRPAPDPRDHGEVPAALAELVRRCMDPNLERRPPSAAALAEALAGVLERPPGPGLATDPGSSSQGSSFVATSPGERALAVVPFRYRGPADEAYLAEALTDELIDLLAMTRGLRVSARGATARFEGEQDVREVGRTLGVDAIIDGTVQRSASRVRIVARLVDVESGFQRWSERFEGRLEDVFELQDRMAKRVAEALRVELTMLGHGAVASAEAVELYLRGRALARNNDPSGRRLAEGLELFERARVLAPAFTLPLAARAHAAVMLWFISPGEGAGDRAASAREAVQEALQRAPEVAETHLAAARLAVNTGDFETAAHELTKALEIAPTYAAAHEYLGMLQCDAGRSREGVKHIELARELDPSLTLGSFAVLRHHAMRGEPQDYEAALEALRRTPNVPAFGIDLFELRFALWQGDVERARRVRVSDHPIGRNPILDVLMAAADALDSELDDELLRARLHAATDRPGSPRLRTAWRQLAVEVLAWRGAHDAALELLELADSEGVLLDADWLERCPVLTPLQSRPELREIRRRVRERADAIWRAGRDP